MLPSWCSCQVGVSKAASSGCILFQDLPFTIWRCLFNQLLGHIMPSLENNMVALEPAREVIPCRGNHRVLALQVPNDLVAGGLEWWRRFVSLSDKQEQGRHHESGQRISGMNMIYVIKEADIC